MFLKICQRWIQNNHMQISFTHAISWIGAGNHLGGPLGQAFAFHSRVSLSLSCMSHAPYIFQTPATQAREITAVFSVSLLAVG